jgi:hypothetical protein
MITRSSPAPAFAALTVVGLVLGGPRPITPEGELAVVLVGLATAQRLLAAHVVAVRHIAGRAVGGLPGLVAAALTTVARPRPDAPVAIAA